MEKRPGKGPFTRKDVAKQKFSNHQSGKEVKHKIIHLNGAFFFFFF